MPKMCCRNRTLLRVNCIQDSCEINLRAVVISNSFYHDTLTVMSHAVIVDLILELLCKPTDNSEQVSMLL